MKRGKCPAARHDDVTGWGDIRRVWLANAEYAGAVTQPGASDATAGGNSLPFFGRVGRIQCVAARVDRPTASVALARLEK